MIRVGVLGHGPYAPHIANALKSQPDIEVVGFYYHQPTFLSRELSSISKLFCSKSQFEYFKERGIKLSGFLEDFLESVDFLLEYDHDDLSIKLTFEGTGFQLSPKDVTSFRLKELSLSEVSIRWISDSLYCCPFFRPALLELKLSQEERYDFIVDFLLSARRVSSVNEEVNLNDFCIYYPFFRNYTLFSIIIFLKSLQFSKNGKSLSVFSLYGIFSTLPEAIDTMRESTGVIREFSSSITDHHLNIKSGLLH
ncbi:MAG: hypothetical protein NZ992_02825 [Candidatus Korarchaeum sp.]|nr:hypothetical protein [Candidatus Korarchaeum sp.]MDW8035571.1 hypothetical protein [Candidatus Korarchaeum sp.]